MGALFISYRRGEAAGEARALFNELAAILGKESVFMDVDSIALGRDFREVLHDRLASCDFMLALIGREWIHAERAPGKRRLDDPTDLVRLEIQAALQRNISVTPVLVQGAQMPAAEQLPEDIRDLAYRNGFELSHTRWESDLQEMLKRLDLNRQRGTRTILQTDSSARTSTEPLSSAARGGRASGPDAQPTQKRPLAVIGASVVAIAIAGGGLLYFVADDRAKTEQAEIAKARADAERSRLEVKAAEARAAAKAANEKAQLSQERARTVPPSRELTEEERQAQVTKALENMANIQHQQLKDAANALRN